ncbi:MAG: TonB-dependent receptor [Pseudomonadota bacterium]|nr:TonB-dependent receptor [Pseudomonadota bacterium]
MSNLWDRERLLRSTILAGFAAAGLAMSPAYAQDAEDEEEDTTEDVVVVTGSLLRRNEFTSTAPIQVVTAEVATLEGLVDAAEMLQTASVASGSVQLNNQFGGFVVEGGTGVNSISLRGLGAQRSLVLINGNRPGPAGVRGQVGAFDLNVIPSSIVQRFEILKDGASSIYGSDAVAGVINVITRTEVDRPELSVQVNAPFEGGGETYDISGAYGLNFDRGNIVLAAQYQLREDLSLGDRDYLSCQQDRVWDAPGGNRIDREDRSITAGTEYSGCNHIYANTIIDNLYGTGRYIPAPDGVGGGPLGEVVPGYRPRANGRYDDPAGQAFYEDVLANPRVLSADAINRQERMSFYASSDFALDMLGGVDWRNEFLFTRRETTSDGWRQFFPLVGGAFVNSLFGVYGYANDPTYDHPLGLIQPVTIWPSNSFANVDYTALNTQLEGGFSPWFGPMADWVWSASVQYSRSDAEYGGNAIIASESGDARFDADAPIYDPYSSDFLSGNYGDAVYDQLTANTVGTTVYEQTVVNAVTTGELFDLPAGPVGAALGYEYRTFSIDDTPDELSRNGDLWGSSSALVTRGDDTVHEFFGELEIPLVAGEPFFESLTMSLSGRTFDYESAGSDGVWKAGLNWQISPTFRMRATQGTSYRAPGLYELYLGDQSAFLSQLSIDPCIDWANSSNANIRTNCAAEGIPGDYTGGASSATIYSGGGAGVLEPETSDARTVGLVYTPEWAALSVAVDYFEIEVYDQIAQLGAASILFSCYAGSTFPNNFCNLFDRAPGSDAVRPNAILEVRDSYLNINSQITDGFDLTVRYEHEFDFGDLLISAQSTWTNTDIVNLFDPSLPSNFETNDFNGTVGDPEFVANGRVAFFRGDWTFNWFFNYIEGTDNQALYEDSLTYQSYYGFQDAYFDAEVESALYHDFSIEWEGDRLSILGGVSNAFDEEPPLISTGVGSTRRGNTALSATQYDLRGRTAFVRVTKTF